MTSIKQRREFSMGIFQLMTTTVLLPAPASLLARAIKKNMVKSKQRNC